MQRMILLSKFCQSVRPSIKHVQCDKTKSVNISTQFKRGTSLAFLHQHTNSSWLRWSTSTRNNGWNWPIPFKKGKLLHHLLLATQCRTSVIGYRCTALRLRLAAYNTCHRVKNCTSRYDAIRIMCKLLLATCIIGSLHVCHWLSIYTQLFSG